MRTCPACGEDTKAETSEACTKCGFSVSGPETTPKWDESVWADEADGTVDAAPEIVVGGAAPAEEPAPAPASQPTFPPAPAPQPVPQSPTGSRSKVAKGWIVLIILGIAFQGFRIFDGCGDVFDDKPGPTAQETEDALSQAAFQAGVAGANVACPDDADETEVGDTFDCDVINLDGTETITVTNHEDEFTWSNGPFYRLKRQAQGAS